MHHSFPGMWRSFGPGHWRRSFSLHLAGRSDKTGRRLASPSLWEYHWTRLPASLPSPAGSVWEPYVHLVFWGINWWHFIKDWWLAQASTHLSRSSWGALPELLCLPLFSVREAFKKAVGVDVYVGSCPLLLLILASEVLCSSQLFHSLLYFSLQITEYNFFSISVATAFSLDFFFHPPVFLPRTSGHQLT